MDGETVFVIDDEQQVRESLCGLLGAAGFRTQNFASAREFLSNTVPKHGCVLADVRMQDMTGLDLLSHIQATETYLPVIIITGHADIPLAVKAMRAGVNDFLEKPIDDHVLINSVQRAFAAGTKAANKASEKRQPWRNWRGYQPASEQYWTNWYEAAPTGQ